MPRQDLTHGYSDVLRVFRDTQKRGRHPSPQGWDSRRKAAVAVGWRPVPNVNRPVPPGHYNSLYDSPIAGPPREQRHNMFDVQGKHRHYARATMSNVEQRSATPRLCKEEEHNEKNVQTAKETTTKQAPAPPPLKEAKPPEASPLQVLLQRIITQEFSSKCTQRSINIVLVICDTLCKSPSEVVEAMLVMEACFSDSLKGKDQQRLLHYWYIVDALMKLFRGRQRMLDAVFVALPHLLLLYVPWNNSKLAKEPWFDREKDVENYKNLFNVWESVVPEKITNDIKILWRDGFPTGAE